MSRNQSHEQGSHAKTPKEFPAKDWKAILKRVKNDIKMNNISLIAAGVAFYGLLSLFPLLIAFVSIYSLFADPSTVEQQIQSFSDIIPQDAESIITTQLHEVVKSSSTKLGWSTFISIFVALWSANKGTMAVIDGFNIAYDEEEKRGFFKKNFVSLSFTLGAVLFMILALTLIALIPPVLSLLQLDRVVELAVSWGRWVLLAVMVVFALSALNRYAPARNEAKWTWVSVGSLSSTVLWLIASAGFSFYVANFGKYNEVYGSLGGVIVLLLWLYFSSFIILLGAELNAEAELQTYRDTTPGQEKPLGRRGAVKADNVPKAG